MVAPQVDEMPERAWKVKAHRPTLILVDATDVAAHKQAPAPRRKRSRRAMGRVGERVLLLTAFCAVGLFFLYSGAAWLWHSATATNPIGSVDAAPIVSVKVQPGDTLWKYASRYGSPDSDVSDQADAIARANHLGNNAMLSPGQTLHIAVTNPGEVAKVERVRQVHLAALPR